MNPLVSSLIGAGVRWVLTLVAARGVVVSDELSTQLVSGAVAVGVLIWSFIQKRKADEAAKAAGQ